MCVCFIHKETKVLNITLHFTQYYINNSFVEMIDTNGSYCYFTAVKPTLCCLFVLEKS